MVILKQFNVYDKDDWNLYAKVMQDNNIISNVDSILAINSLSYTIKHNKEKIGMLKIVPEVDNFSIDMGILQEYTNNGYGVETLLNAIELIDFFDDDYNKIIIRTNFSNKSVIECARKIGFIYDIEEIERCMNEGEEYLVLSKYNTKNKTKTMI